jgi:hypothetical protein
MNYLQKREQGKKISELFRANYPAGCIKLSNETLSHFTVKCQLAHWFYKNGYQVYSEASLKGTNCRPDLFIRNDTSCYIVEVLQTETDKKFEEKLKKYPKDIPIIKVKVKDFDYDNFKF